MVVLFVLGLLFFIVVVVVCVCLCVCVCERERVRERGDSHLQELEGLLHQGIPVFKKE